MTGTPYLIRIMGYGLTKPKNPVPGMDIAGRVVVEIGRDVTRFAVDDEVFGVGTGTFAEFPAAKEAKLVRKTRDRLLRKAAVSTISGITALQALTTIGRLQRGQHVLVIIDYTTQQIDDGDQRYDLIIDTGGRNTISRLRRAFTPTGTLVIVGGEDGDRLTGGIGRQLRAALLSPSIKQRLTFFMSSESLEAIKELAEHLASRTVTPAVGRQFDLDDVPRAIEAMEAGALTGKAVIKIKP